jgi:protein gp37
MSTNTGIQWTDATWNPIRGCSRVSEGCRNCYAEAVAARFSGHGQTDEGLARRTSNGAPRWTGKIMFVEKHLEDPIRWRKPRRIFVNSMSDLFHEGVTDEQLDRIFAVMAKAQRHTFQVLTKRPERMVAYTRARLVGLPLPNVWLGVSVEDQKAAYGRIKLLLDTPAAVRFLSCEPLLGPIDLTPFLYDEVEATSMPDFESPIASNRGLNWVIVGGESGVGARPCDLAWIRQIVTDCVASGVAVFVKQLGAYPVNNNYNIRLEHGHGGDPLEWQPDLRVRQFPGVAA